jgi:hypothetical protein
MSMMFSAKRISHVALALGSGVVAAEVGTLNRDAPSRSDQQQPFRTPLFPTLNRSDPDGEYSIVDHKDASDGAGSGAEVANVGNSVQTARNDDQPCARAQIHLRPEFTAPSLHSVSRKPVAPAHIDAAMETLCEKPQMLVDLIEENLGFVAGPAGARFVNRLLRDRDTIDTVMMKVEKHNQTLIAHHDVYAPPSDVQKQWDDLCAKYGCSICRDVRAAPIVLSCSHSFCYTCVRDLKNQATVEDDTVVPSLAHSPTVVHKCPDCRKEMEGTENFSRDYDEVIFAQVEQVPECDMKTAYKDRRNAYFEHEHVQMAEKLANLNQNASPRGPTSGTRESLWSRLAAFTADVETPTAEEDNWYEVFKYYAVPYLTFAVVALATTIFYAAKRR